jgi:hypothetical protein
MTVLKSDLAAWQSARTLADLGDLTARWIEGGLASQPGYCGSSDVDDPERLVPLLARLNRAGFVTTGSQEAFNGTGYDGAHWQQRATVEGFATGVALMRFSDAAHDAGLLAVAYDPPSRFRWRYGYRDSVAVTTREGRYRTGFGVQLPRRHIRDGWIGYGMCHRDAVKALCGAWQLTLIDPEWGRPDVLWETLERALAESPCPYAICHHNHPELQQEGRS